MILTFLLYSTLATYHEYYLRYFLSLFISPFQLANINMKFFAVIAVVASLAMTNATSVLNRRAPQPLNLPPPPPPHLVGLAFALLPENLNRADRHKLFRILLLNPDQLHDLNFGLDFNRNGRYELLTELCRHPEELPRLAELSPAERHAFFRLLFDKLARIPPASRRNLLLDLETPPPNPAPNSD
jgi:hypothetical protein